jgi:hypothetical protein
MTGYYCPRGVSNELRQVVQPRFWQLFASAMCSPFTAVMRQVLIPRSNAPLPRPPASGHGKDVTPLPGPLGQSRLLLLTTSLT